eukprot:953179-Prymnesium_polylepis.1
MWKGCECGIHTTHFVRLAVDTVGERRKIGPQTAGTAQENGPQRLLCGSLVLPTQLTCAPRARKLPPMCKGYCSSPRLCVVAGAHTQYRVWTGRATCHGHLVFFKVVRMFGPVRRSGGPAVRWSVR